MSDNPICMNEERARRLMAEAGLDVLLANSVFNVAYLSGFVQHHWVWDGIQHFMDRNIWRDEAKPIAGFCLDPAKPPFLASNWWVTRHNYIYPTVQLISDMKVTSGIHPNQFAFFALDWTIHALRERGLETARIGYEETRLPTYYLKYLQQLLPQATLVPADNLFWRIRAVKTPEEIRRLREAFRIATQVYRDTFEMMKYLSEPGVTKLDNELDAYLTGVVNTLLEDGALFDCPRSPTVDQLKAALRSLGDAGSMAGLFENIKFARLMKGRLWFYGQEVLWFDSDFLIRNELNRIRANFYETPLRLFAKITYNQDTTAEGALELLRGDVFGNEEIEACHRFAAIAGPECPEHELKKRALEIAAVFDPFLLAIDRLMEVAKTRLGGSSWQ